MGCVGWKRLCLMQRGRTFRRTRIVVLGIIAVNAFNSKPARETPKTNKTCLASSTVQYFPLLASVLLFTFTHLLDTNTNHFYCIAWAIIHCGYLAVNSDR